MSAMGQKLTSRHARVMSVLPLNADIRQRIEHVCFVPIADLADRHRVRKLRTAIKDPLRNALGIVLAAELPPMGSARAQLIHRDR